VHSKLICGVAAVVKVNGTLISLHSRNRVLERLSLEITKIILKLLLVPNF
jgi:hypothetical protein